MREVRAKGLGVPEQPGATAPSQFICCWLNGEAHAAATLLSWVCLQGPFSLRQQLLRSPWLSLTPSRGSPAGSVSALVASTDTRSFPREAQIHLPLLFCHGADPAFCCPSSRQPSLLSGQVSRPFYAPSYTLPVPANSSLGGPAMASSSSCGKFPAETTLGEPSQLQRTRQLS